MGFPKNQWSCQGACQCGCEWCQNGGGAGEGPHGLSEVSTEVSTGESHPEGLSEVHAGGCIPGNICSMGFPKNQWSCQGACQCGCEWCQNGGCAGEGPHGLSEVSTEVSTGGSHPEGLSEVHSGGCIPGNICSMGFPRNQWSCQGACQCGCEWCQNGGCAGEGPHGLSEVSTDT